MIHCLLSNRYTDTNMDATTYKYIHFSVIYINGKINNDQNAPIYGNNKIICSYLNDVFKEWALRC